MSGVLLDTNVLIALLWPAHQSHALVQRWFAHNARRGWATCPLTQTGFVRIVSNPSFSRDAVEPEQALLVLKHNLQHPSHRFWPAAIDCADALAPCRGRLVGHRQVTDAYLLGLAIHSKGRLVTLDRGFASLLSAQSPERSRIELLDAPPVT